MLQKLTFFNLKNGYITARAVSRESHFLNVIKNKPYSSNNHLKQKELIDSDFSMLEKRHMTAKKAITQEFSLVCDFLFNWDRQSKKNHFRDGYLLLFFLLVSVFLVEEVFAEENKNEKVNDFDLDKFRRILSSHSGLIAQEIEYAKDKEVILVIGDTGAGKSTTVNYLLGSKMEIDEKSFRQVKVRKGQPEYATIGQDISSETVRPQIYTSDSKLCYCDCPGFLDTKGKEQQVANTVNIQSVVNTLNKVSGILIVIEASSLTGRARGMLNIVKTLSELLKISKGEMSELEKSLLFVFTKSSPKEKDKIFYKIDNCIASLNKEKASKSQGFLKKMSEFLKVTSEDSKLNQELHELDDQMRILYLIKKTNSIVIDVIDEGNSRSELLDHIKNLKPLSKDIFQFNFTDTAHTTFNEMVTQIASACNPVLDEAIKIRNNISQLKDQEKQIVKNIGYYREIMHLTEEAYKAKNSELVMQYEAAVKEIHREINSLEKQKKILLEKQNTFDSSELITHWSDSIDEKRSWYGWVGWTEKKFNYADIPFFEAKLDFENGEIIPKLNEPEKGEYQSTYQSSLGKDGKASVAIRVEKRHLPGNQALLRSIGEDLIQIQYKTNELTSRKEQMVDEENKRKEDDYLKNAKKAYEKLSYEYQTMQTNIKKEAQLLGDKEGVIKKEDIMLLRTVSKLITVSALVTEVIEKYDKLSTLNKKIDNEEISNNPYSFWNSFGTSALAVAVGASIYCARYGCPPVISPPSGNGIYLRNQGHSLKSDVIYTFTLTQFEQYL